MIQFVHMIHEYGRKDLLDSYIKVCIFYYFKLMHSGLPLNVTKSLCRVELFFNIMYVSTLPKTWSAGLLIFQYVFNCVELKLHTVLTAPLHMFLDPTQQDFLLGHKFMQYSSFFFDAIVKSMVQYLINTGRIKVLQL